MLRRPPSSRVLPYMTLFFFFFNDTATTEIYTLSLHDALPIFRGACARPARPTQLLLLGPGLGRAPDHGIPAQAGRPADAACALQGQQPLRADRKSTRLNSSH